MYIQLEHHTIPEMYELYSTLTSNYNPDIYST